MHAIIELHVNGDRRKVGIPAHYTLLEALRYGLGLTGSKQGCDKGDCGACTVLLEGEPVLSCITPAWEAEGRPVMTVEGIAGVGMLHPLQEAFEITGGAQCGFCTPGVLMSAYALLQQNSSPSLTEVQEALSGNLCRCTGYTKIYEAVMLAAGGADGSGRVNVNENVGGTDGSGSVNVNVDVGGTDGSGSVNVNVDVGGTDGSGSVNEDVGGEGQVVRGSERRVRANRVPEGREAPVVPDAPITEE
jgi:aerobic-type carbon monoxide dehydrogenase small subunit (CoxS/CutS family)